MNRWNRVYKQIFQVIQELRFGKISLATPRRAHDPNTGGVVSRNAFQALFHLGTHKGPDSQAIYVPWFLEWRFKSLLKSADESH